MREMNGQIVAASLRDRSTLVFKYHGSIFQHMVGSEDELWWCVMRFEVIREGLRVLRD